MHSAQKKVKCKVGYTRVELRIGEMCIGADGGIGRKIAIAKPKDGKEKRVKGWQTN